MAPDARIVFASVRNARPGPIAGQRGRGVAPFRFQAGAGVVSLGVGDKKEVEQYRRSCRRFGERHPCSGATAARAGLGIGLWPGGKRPKETDDTA